MSETDPKITDPDYFPHKGTDLDAGLSDKARAVIRSNALSTPLISETVEVEGITVSADEALRLAHDQKLFDAGVISEQPTANEGSGD